MTFAKGLLALVPLVLLAACATTPPVPPSVAVTAITGKTCTAAPSLKDAVSLMPAKESAFNEVSTLVDTARPCLIDGDASSNYVVYALPDHPDNHIITVGGVHEVLRTFAPSVSLLDADGKMTRTFADDRFATYGDVLGVQFRPTEQDRFILVQSNPALVGKSVSTTETRVGTYSGYAPMTAYSYGYSYQQQIGVDGKHSRVFSHEGYVQVIVQAMAGNIGLPNDKAKG